MYTSHRSLWRFLSVLVLAVILICGNFVGSTGIAVRPGTSPSSNARSKTKRAVSVSQAVVPKRDDELLVRFHSATGEEQKEIVAATIGARRKKRLRGESDLEKWEVPAGQQLQNQAIQLMLNPAVEFVEPNFLVNADQINPIVPDDDQFSE